MSRFVFAGESDDYRRRREELLAAEIVLCHLGGASRTMFFAKGHPISARMTRRTWPMWRSPTSLPTDTTR